MKKILSVMLVSVLLAISFTALMPVNQVKAATLVSRIVTNEEGKTYLEVDGQPYLDMHIQNCGTSLVYEGANLPLSFLENMYEKTSNLNIKTASVIFRWNDIEEYPEGTYHWDVINKYIDWANKYGVRLDLAWFGHVSNDAYYRYPYGSDPSCIYGSIPLYVCEGESADIITSEFNALTALFNHLASYDVNHRVIFFQIHNEPNIGGIDLNNINAIGNMIHNSNYQVATRVNNSSWDFNDSVWGLDGVDAFGLDPYVHTVSQVANFIANTEKGYRHLAENGGDCYNSTSLAVTALINGGFYNIWELDNDENAPGWQTSIFGNENTNAPFYTTWQLGTMPPMTHQGNDIKRLYGSINQFGSIIAVAPPSRMAGFNVSTDNPATSKTETKSIQGYNVTFSCSDGSVGIAVRDGNYVYCASDSGGSVTFNGVTCNSGQFITLTVQAAVTMGDTTVEATDDNYDKGQIFACKSTLASQKTLNSISVYLPTISGKVRLAVYGDSSGHPGSLIAQTNEATPTSTGWLTLNTTTTPTLAAGTYWVSFQTDSDNMHFRMKAGASGDGYCVPYTYGAFPSTWSGGGALTNVYSLYATLTDSVPAAVTMGDTTVEATDDNYDKGQIFACKSTLVSQKTLNSISVYLPAISGKVRLAVYGNSSGHPGSLIAQTNEATPTSTGWLTLNTTTTPTLAEGTYWVSFQTDSDNMHFRMKAGASGDGYYVPYTYGAFPSTWSGGGALTNVYSLYATLQ